MAETSAFLWIAIAGALAAFFTAFSIGANDVANTFSSAVGGKSLSLQWAVALGAILEIIGATLLSGTVTETLRSKIVDFSVFQGEPSILMLGMLCCLIGSGFVVFMATQLGLPISTTHSIIGSLIGFAVSSGNWKAVRWSMIAVVVSCWIIAPLTACVASGLFFSIIRHFVLRKRCTISSCFRIVFFLMVITGVSFGYFITFANPLVIDTRCEQIIAEELVTSSPCHISRWFKAHLAISIGCWFGTAIVVASIQAFIVRIITLYRLQGNEAEGGAAAKIEKGVANISTAVADTDRERVHGFFASHMERAAMHCDSSKMANEQLQNIHTHAEVFDPQVETFFSACQILSSCASCIAHSTNDTANAVGPLSVIYFTYINGSATINEETPWFILFVCGLALASGLVLLGYKVVATMGSQIIKITPSRGYSIDVAASLVVMVFSAFGIPLSTTHSAVGSTVGVGLVEKRKEGCSSLQEHIKSSVNWKLLRVVFGFWVITLVVSGAFTMLIFCFAAYAPSLVK